MQSDSGLLRWLKVPFLYNLFQEAVGAKAARRRLIQNHVRAMPGDKMIDIGCGPAPQALRSLPEVEYLGFDTNAQYIASAKRTHGSKGTFVIGDTYSLRGDSRFQNADIVIAIGPYQSVPMPSHSGEPAGGSATLSNRPCRPTQRVTMPLIAGLIPGST